MVYFLSIVVIVSIIFLMICGIENKPFTTIYCYIFEHKAWKLWNRFLNVADGFVFVEYCDTIDADKFCLYDKYNNVRYYAYIWNTITNKKYCSIHYNTDCILSWFDEYHSEKMAKLLLLKKINTN